MAAGWALIPGLSPTGRMVAISLSVVWIMKYAAERALLSPPQICPAWPLRIGWYLLWPGLDARAFFVRRAVVHPALGEWLIAGLMTLLGPIAVWVVAPRFSAQHDLVAGWIATIGLVCSLHFGLFHLAALAWRRAGRDVAQIMRAPIRSTSLHEFWSRRWNRAFRDFAYPLVFRPLVRRGHPRLAEWAVFLFSGLVHELAISVPAGGGYGLPLVYFLLQGCGCQIERRLSTAGLRLQGSIAGWLFTALFVVPAAYWLFHPTFLRRVILPIVGG
jgi:alginate O-acetyltransferase complex protein AlgI